MRETAFTMKKFLCITLSAALIGSMTAAFHNDSLVVWADEPYEYGPGIGAGPVKGPSYVYTPKKEIGPGIGTETPGGTTLLPVILVRNDFLDKPIENPIVKITDKYSHEQMEADISALKGRYSDKMQVNVIGRSRDGRAIYEIVIGNPDAASHVLFQGAIHGREYMTPLLMMNQLELALANYDTGHYDDRALSDMFAQVALHYVPMTNPDGVAISQYGLSAVGSDALRQEILACYNRDVEAGKTVLSLEEYLPYWKSNGAGVDLNHNFPARWEEIQIPTTAGSYANYKGPAPLSEPESQALAALTGQRNWAATVSYHSMGNIIYWDTEPNQSADSSLALAESISKVTGYPLDGSRGKGGYKDWVQMSGQTAPSVTIETGSVACPMPVSEYESVWNQNKSVWARVMCFVLTP